jgi:hypothetical protein
MFITVRQRISQVLDGFKVSTDDTSLYEEFIYNELRDVANELMRQETDKGRMDESNAQPLFNFELKQVDISECDKFQSGITILKSVNKLPKIIDNERFGKLVFSIYTNTGTRLELITFNRWDSMKRKRYSMKLPSCFILNDYLYVVNYDELATCLSVNLLAFFEDPIEVYEMETGECVYIPDQPFYIPGYLAGRVIRMVKESLSRTYNIAPDIRNDAKEQITPNP